MMDIKVAAHVLICSCNHVVEFIEKWPNHQVDFKRTSLFPFSQSVYNMSISLFHLFLNFNFNFSKFYS